jgi:Protein of unknown function (DUF3631)
MTAEARSLAMLLEAIDEFLRRFVVLADLQAVAVVLWTAHTYVHDAFDCSPYLWATSPVKRSGKSRLLDVLELLVARPWRVVSPSEAVVYRKIESSHPTLLLDEVDAIWRARRGSENHEGLRALLNAGNRRGVRVPRCAGSRGDQLVEFDTYCPKALAGIGDLPDTVADRSITVAMKRRTRTEPVERFRRRELRESGDALRDDLAAWAEGAVVELEQARPDLPDELDDRAADAWEPLLAIADMAGGDWPRRAPAAALELSAGERDDESLAIRLLADIHRTFDSRPDVDRFATKDLLELLSADDEAPWSTYDRRTGKGLSAAQLARLLHPFGVLSRTVRLPDDVRAKGYLRESFEDVWKRYVTPVTELLPLRGDNPHGYAENSPSEAVTRHASEMGGNPRGKSDVTASRQKVGKRLDGENREQPDAAYGEVDDDPLEQLREEFF